MGWNLAKPAHLPTHIQHQLEQLKYPAQNTKSLPHEIALDAMNVANLQAAGYRDEQQALSALKQAAGSTSGRKEALDAANQIALAQVTQMQSLRELMVAKMQAEGTYMAAQTQATQAREESIRDATRITTLAQALRPSRLKTEIARTARPANSGPLRLTHASEKRDDGAEDREGTASGGSSLCSPFAWKAY